MKQGKIQIDDFDSITSYETAEKLLDAIDSLDYRKEQIDFIGNFMLDVCLICEAYFKENSKEAVIDELCNKFRVFLAE